MTLKVENIAESPEETMQLSVEVAQRVFQECVDSAKAAVEREDWEEAVEQYKRAVALQPVKQAWIYLTLGSLLVKQDHVEEAISCYKVAHSLKPDDAKVYALMGVALEKQQERDRAITSYRRALTLDTEQPVWVHDKLGNALSERALEDLKETAFRYAQVMCRRDRFSHLHLLNKTLQKIFGLEREYTEESIQDLFEKFSEEDLTTFIFLRRLVKLGFAHPRGSVNPAGYYVVSERLKAIYCSIPKNACTLLKTMMVEHSELKSAFEGSSKNVHSFLYHRAKEVSAHHLLNCLESDDYFKFVVLRNPFDRIVSGYLDKFAKHTVPEAFVQKVILAVQTSLGLDQDIEKSITFSQFVDYLARTPNLHLNDHWRPQYSFTALVDFDFVGQFERLDNVVSNLEKKLSINIRKEVSTHTTHYKKFNTGSQFHTMYPYELRALSGGMPVASDLFSATFKCKFEQRYQQDIQLYNCQIKMAV